MGFNGIKHNDLTAVYKRTAGAAFQIDCDSFFHIIHVDGATHPTNLKLYLPYKYRLLGQSAFWIFYVKESTVGDTITFECVDPEAGINETDGPAAAYTFTSEGNTLLFFVLVPGGINSNRFYIRNMHPGIPHVSIVGTGIAAVTDAYPLFTVDVPDTIVAAGDRCGVTELPDHTYTVDVDKTTVTAGDRCVVTEAPAETFTIDVEKTTVTAGDRCVVTEAPAETFTIDVTKTTVAAGTNCTVTEAPPETFTIDCPTVTITSGGGCTITGSFPNFTVTVP